MLTENQRELDDALAGRDYASERALKEYLLALFMADCPAGHFANLVHEAREAVRG